MNENIDNLPPPTLIQEPHQFREAVAALSRQPILAVDTEANSLYAYQEQVCLIQISSSTEDYIIDPLALDDLEPLKAVFADPAIEKVFHASEYDVNILWDDLGIEIENLFDTMLAARILGWRKLGLDSLLEERFGIKVNKSFQRADWSRRPLPEKMLRYAQLDTHFLIDIRHWLAERLKARGRWDVAQEDFQRACRAHLRPRREKLPPCWRMKEAKQLPPQKAAVLMKLSEFRDQTAREKDLPLFKILGKKTMLALAKACPTTRRELAQLNLSQRRQVERYSQGLLQAIREGLQAEPISPPRQERPDDAVLSRERALKDWRKGKAREAGVNSAVILPRYLLAEIARKNPNSREELSEILAEVPLRSKHFGKEILAALSEVS